MLKSYFNKNFCEAGCDEVGRGCLAGPVVAAAVILPNNYKNEWINDSKSISEELRVSLAIEIKNNAISYAIAEVSPSKIDEINILNASFLAMHRAIEKLNPKPEHLLIDGNRFSPFEGIPHTCIIKGDTKYLSIAAASILAKTYRDELMIEYAKKYPGYSWETNVGYPTIAHRKALTQLGITPLHRLSFKLQ